VREAKGHVSKGIPIRVPARVFVALLAKYFVIPYASALVNAAVVKGGILHIKTYAIPCTARFSCSGRLRQLRSCFLSRPPRHFVPVYAGSIDQCGGMNPCSLCGSSALCVCYRLLSFSSEMCVL
jgi:hypothetical protein